jgi:hypothetical protein
LSIGAKIFFSSYICLLGQQDYWVFILWFNYILFWIVLYLCLIVCNISQFKCICAIECNKMWKSSELFSLNYIYCILSMFNFTKSACKMRNVTLCKPFLGSRWDLSFFEYCMRFEGKSKCLTNIIYLFIFKK